MLQYRIVLYRSPGLGNVARALEPDFGRIATVHESELLLRGKIAITVRDEQQGRAVQDRLMGLGLVVGLEKLTIEGKTILRRGTVGVEGFVAMGPLAVSEHTGLTLEELGEPPLFTIRVGSPQEKKLTALAVGVVAITLSLVMLELGWLPFLYKNGGGGPSVGLMVLVSVIAGLPAVVWAIALVVRLGDVRVYEDQVVLEKSNPPLRVRWRDLAAYRDDSADYVQLLPRGQRANIFLTIPTPRERWRTDILRLLDAKGIPRREE